MPLALRQQLDHLAQGSFVERGVNVLAFGLPGTGKTHARCAWATAWWKPATPSSSLRPTAWCRNCYLLTGGSAYGVSYLERDDGPGLNSRITR